MNFRKSKRRIKNITCSAAMMLMILGSIGCSTDYPVDTPVFNTTNLENAPENLMVHFIDVGQADSILVQVPNGVNFLIDAGNNADAEDIIAYLEDLGVEGIDIVIGTHPHEDHIGSLDKVIENFDIGQVIMPKATATTKTFEEVLTAIQDKGLKITEAKAGDKLNLKTKDAMDIPIDAEILSPKSNHYDETNDYSVVLRLDYGENSFLFTGDAEEIVEEEILSARDEINVDVLKVGHHGSSSSTTHDFLKKISPEVAVITVGEGNSYGHPHKSVINRLKSFGVEIYRTDKMGTIIAEADGSEVVWSFEK